jgi:hypothetical protein
VLEAAVLEAAVLEVLLGIDGAEAPSYTPARPTSLLEGVGLVRRAGVARRDAVGATESTMSGGSVDILQPRDLAIRPIQRATSHKNRKNLEPQ